MLDCPNIGCIEVGLSTVPSHTTQVVASGGNSALHWLHTLNWRGTAEITNGGNLPPQ